MAASMVRSFLSQGILLPITKNSEGSKHSAPDALVIATRSPSSTLSSCDTAREPSLLELKTQPENEFPSAEPNRSSWPLCQRMLHQYLESYKDRLPKHEESNSPEFIEKSDGMWKVYTRAEYWEINKRRTDKDVFEGDVVNAILQKMDLEYNTENDMPVENLPNPYVKTHRKCILCQYNVKVDHKNTQLLSQFISPHTGRIYGRHITGLCIHMQKRVSKLIKRSRLLGFMPAVYKKPEFLKDPQLYDPFSRKKTTYGE